MNKTFCRAMVLVVVGAVSVSSVSAEETIASVEKKIEASWAKVKTLSARTNFENAKVTGEIRMATKYDGVYWHMKRDGKELFRYDMSSMLTVSSGEQSQDQPTQKRILVGDGTYVYNQTEVYGHPVAEKVNQLESGIGLGGKNLFDWLGLEKYNLSFLRSDKVDAKDVYVLEGVHSQAGRARTMMCYISKESGMLLLRETFRDGQLRTRLVVSDVDLNEELPSDIFDARPSPDIGIIDKTGKKKEMTP